MRLLVLLFVINLLKCPIATCTLVAEKTALI